MLISSCHLYFIIRKTIFVSWLLTIIPYSILLSSLIYSSLNFIIRKITSFSIILLRLLLRNNTCFQWIISRRLDLFLYIFHINDLSSLFFKFKSILLNSLISHLSVFNYFIFRCLWFLKSLLANKSGIRTYTLSLFSQMRPWSCYLIFMFMIIGKSWFYSRSSTCRLLIFLDKG